VPFPPYLWASKQEEFFVLLEVGSTLPLSQAEPGILSPPPFPFLRNESSPSIGLDPPKFAGPSPSSYETIPFIFSTCLRARIVPFSFWISVLPLGVGFSPSSSFLSFLQADPRGNANSCREFMCVDFPFSWSGVHSHLVTFSEGETSPLPFLVSIPLPSFGASGLKRRRWLI